MDARDLLITDCWVKIFKKLEPEDLLNVSQVCQLFSQITRSAHYDFYEGDWKASLILPFVFPYLCVINEEKPWRKGLPLNPRLVCKTWKNSIDKIIQEKNLCPSFIFLTAAKIDQFTAQFGKSNLSVILLRKICLWRGVGEADFNFQQSAMLFVQEFGIQIWELSVYEQSSTFLHLLRYTPNLKILKVNPNDRVGDEQVLNPLIDLPDLPELKRFSTLHGVQLIVNHILKKYGPQLEDLAYYGVVELTDLSVAEHFINIQTFGSLKKLEFSTKNGPAIFAGLRSLNCPLEELFIFFSISPHLEAQAGNSLVLAPEQTWEIDRFLHSIRHLQFRKLSITRNGSVNIVESGELRTEEYSNSITDLEVSFNDAMWGKDAQVSFNFLKAFNQLERIKYSWWLMGRGSGTAHHVGLPKSVDFFDGISIREVFGDERLRKSYVYNSNVWEEVESLTSLELELKEFGDKKTLHFSREECNTFRTLRA